MKRLAAAFAFTFALMLSACGGGADAGESRADNPSTETASPADAAALTERVDAIQAAVTRWRSTTTLADAQAGAEAALNLVVGPQGPGYGDADGDGSNQGENEQGLLPGLAGEGRLGAGLAQAAAVAECAEADVLGGSWSDPAARWATAHDVYDAWTPSNNTMPELPSHPQRVVGWATLTLALNGASEDMLDAAREYAGHAQLHVDVTRTALEPCLR
jgi:hypothetical protein